jgi:hypothetical protein
MRNALFELCECMPNLPLTLRCMEDTANPSFLLIPFSISLLILFFFISSSPYLHGGTRREIIELSGRVHEIFCVY